MYSKADPNERLVVQVLQFQKNTPITFKLMDETNQESTKFRIDEKGHIFNKDVRHFSEKWWDLLTVTLFTSFSEKKNHITFVFRK